MNFKKHLFLLIIAGLLVFSLQNSVYALGPDVTVPIVIKEKLIALVTARYQWEFGAKSNLQGNMFNLFLQFPFFSEDN